MKMCYSRVSWLYILSFISFFFFFFFFVPATFSTLPPSFCCFFLCYVKSAGESRSQHITHELILMVGSFGARFSSSSFLLCMRVLMDIRLPDGETCFCSISISFSPMEWPVHDERLRIILVKKKKQKIFLCP